MSRPALAFWGFVFAAMMLVGCMNATQDRRKVRPVVWYEGSVFTGAWSANGETALFLGIPFAEPPVGPRRWREPVPLSQPVDVEATRYAAACMQTDYMITWYRDLIVRFGGDPASFPVPEFSEDCLYLNVWTPAIDPDAGLPVMVWIHGGGHRGGWPNEPNYIGDVLAKKGVVVVSVAYRLDVFGFFAHPELEMSNFGLLDQIAALEWVSENIAEFGGDAANVTVFGESAGASSIGYLLASPLNDGLFQRAIHQSAGYQLVNFDTREQFIDRGRELERRVLGDRDDIEALRAVPARELLTAAADVYHDYQPDVVVDGHSLTETVRSALDRDRASSVDLLIGSNADEWLMYLDEDSSEADIGARLREYGLADTAAVIEALSADRSVLRRLDRLVTAHEFVCPSLELAAAAANDGKRSYAYYFSRVRPGPGGASVGAYHGAELPYVFDKHDDWLPTVARDRELTELMGGYWAAFARTGDPNFPGAPEWPEFTPGESAVLEFGEATRVIAHPETDLCRAMARSE